MSSGLVERLRGIVGEEACFSRLEELGLNNSTELFEQLGLGHRLAPVTARLLGAPNASTELDRETFEETLPKISALVEEPIASPSVVPMYHVSERARRDATRGISGASERSWEVAL